MTPSVFSHHRRRLATRLITPSASSRASLPGGVPTQRTTHLEVEVKSPSMLMSRITVPLTPDQAVFPHGFPGSNLNEFVESVSTRNHPAVSANYRVSPTHLWRSIDATQPRRPSAGFRNRGSRHHLRGHPEPSAHRPATHGRREFSSGASAPRHVHHTHPSADNGSRRGEDLRPRSERRAHVNAPSGRGEAQDITSTRTDGKHLNDAAAGAMSCTPVPDNRFPTPTNPRRTRMNCQSNNYTTPALHADQATAPVAARQTQKFHPRWDFSRDER